MQKLTRMTSAPTLSRRQFATGTAAALASIAVVRAPARAAQWAYKYASNLAVDHPLDVYMRQCWDAVRHETGGRLDVTMFPNSQLGGDTAVLTQLRSGAVQFFTLDGGILQGVVPVAAIQGIGFAFKDSIDAFHALDGALGDYVRREIAAKGLYVHPKMWENGMRQITSSTKPIHTADDLAGFTIRTPAGALWVDLFKSLGASPSAINFNETYSALQTKIVDGEENPYAIIDSAHLYEVQKYISVTNHMWSAYHLLGNMDAWKALPADVQAIVDRNLTTYALEQRRATALRNASLANQLARRGMIVSHIDPTTFRNKLNASGFYQKWKTAFGADAWTLLEQKSGKLG
jgi:tripartite ATP-independent transporter DctP family solute receptor